MKTNDEVKHRTLAMPKKPAPTRRAQKRRVRNEMFAFSAAESKFLVIENCIGGYVFTMTVIQSPHGPACSGRVFRINGIEVPGDIFEVALRIVTASSP